MSTDTEVSQLIINTLTKAQYKALKDAGSINEAELYMVTDETIDVATTSAAGIVKPDGTTITITDDGTISVVSDGSSEDYLTSETATATYQTLANLSTELSSTSTDTQYPSAKAVYDLIQELSTKISTLEAKVTALETSIDGGTLE